MPEAIIDDFSLGEIASNGQRWRYFSDRVMGGVSTGHAHRELVAGRTALRLQGQVSLENNGGFVQVALDLAPEAYVFNASEFQGVAITLYGDGGTYAVNLRTTHLRYPWQSYRSTVTSGPEWHRWELPFNRFIGHRTDRPLEPGRLRRIGLIAIGEARVVDVALGDLRFY